MYQLHITSFLGWTKLTDITEIEIKNESDDNFIWDSIAKLTDSEGNVVLDSAGVSAVSQKLTQVQENIKTKKVNNILYGIFFTFIELSSENFYIKIYFY